MTIISGSTGHLPMTIDTTPGYHPMTIPVASGLSPMTTTILPGQSPMIMVMHACLLFTMYDTPLPTQRALQQLGDRLGRTRMACRQAASREPGGANPPCWSVLAPWERVQKV